MTGYRLTEPVRIAAVTAPSRVLFGPHETNLGDGRALSSRHVAYYARRAAGGAGVIVTETASVTEDDWPYERAPLANQCGPGWSAIASACRPYSTIVLGGLGHSGSQGSSAFSQSVMWAPSRVADVVSREPPAELDLAGIDRLVDGFAASARSAVRSGLDGVEIDAGAWSILRQFQSGLTNLRGDEYGRDRQKLTTEVLSAVRTAIGDDLVLALRLSCDELAPWAGITPDHASDAIVALAGLVDVITVIRGGPYSTSAYRPDSHTEAGFNRQLCQRMRQAVNEETLIAFQGSVVDPDFAEQALAEGVCDLVEMTRAQIADARLVDKLRAGEVERVRPCLLCNQACRVRDNRNPIVSCVVDPSAGHETLEADPDSDRSVAGPAVLVVGGGPAGLECARVLAAAGRQVLLVERQDRFGGSVPVAALGHGRARLELSVRWLESECARHGVTMESGRECQAADIHRARSDGWSVVLATGGRPILDRYNSPPPPLVVDAGSALGVGRATWPAGPVVVFDPVGDSVAVSVAERLAAEGAEVTFVCPDPVAGTQLSRTGDLADANVRLERLSVQRRLRSKVTYVGGGGVSLEDVFTGEPSTLRASVFVDCGHRIADEALYEQIGDPAVHRAGDCVAPRSILEAILEGRRRAEDILTTRSATVSSRADTAAGAPR